MVLHIADRYPNVKAIVHVGHSAGGQLLSRYSFGTPVYDVLRERGIYVRYVIANPSSVLYFDRQRPDLIAGKGFVDYRSRTPVLAEGECKEFNTYKYGLDGMVPYMTRRPVAAMLASFRKRDVFLFQRDSGHRSDGRRTGSRLSRPAARKVPARARTALLRVPRSFLRTRDLQEQVPGPGSRHRARRRRDVQERGRQTHHLHRCRQRGDSDSRRGRDAVRLRNSRWSSTAVAACAIAPNSPPNLDSRKPIATG